MVTTRGNLDQADEKGRNPDKSSDIIDIQEETQAGIDNLRESTIDGSINSVGTKSDLIIQQKGLEYKRDIHTPDGFLIVLNKLLEEIEDTKIGISKRGLSKAGKETMKLAKAKLKQYEDKIKDKKNKLEKSIKKGSTPQIYETDIQQVISLKSDIDEVRKSISLGQWGELSNLGSFGYNSPEIAKKSNKLQAKNLEFNQKFQEELKQGAILNIFNGNIQKANEFFRRIAEGKYDQADYQLFVTNSVILRPCCQKYGINIPTNPVGLISRGQTVGGGVEVITNKPRQSMDYSHMDWGDTFKQGGVSGILDKLLSNCSNMTSGQRDVWKTVGVLGCVAGGFFGLYKFYTNEKLGLWGKAGITAATIFGSQALTGKGPISLFSEWMTGGASRSGMQSKFGDAVGGLDNSRHEIADFTVPAAQSLMLFNGEITVGNINAMTQGFRNNNQHRTEFYNQSCSKIQRNYGVVAMESFQARFSSNFDENKREAWLASFGVTSSTNQRENVHELANNAIMNQTILEKFLSENKVKITSDSDKKEELNKYIKGKNEENEVIEIDDLKAHINDWFIAEPKEEQAPNPSQGPQPNPSQGPQPNPSQGPQPNPSQETTPSTPVPNPEIQKEKQIEQAIQNGLEKIYTHFEPKIKKINRIPGMKDIKKTDITKQFPELAKIIKSEFIVSDNGNKIINIDETKMGNIFDNFLKKLCTPQSTVPNYVKRAILGKNWNSLKVQLQEYKNKRNQTKYNNMRENFTVIFNNIFVPIDSTLRSQNVTPNIKCNRQTFNNVNDAIQSMDIFKI